MLVHNEVSPGISVPVRPVSVTSLSRERSNSIVWIGYGIALLLFTGVFAVWQAEPVPDHVHAAGVLVATLCLFPLVLWYARGRLEVPMFELICIAYLMAFSTPLYLQMNGLVLMSKYTPFSWDSMGHTLVLVILGITALLGGYYGLRGSGLMCKLPQVDLPLSEVGRLNYIRVALLIGFGSIIMRSIGFGSGSSSSFEQFFSIAQNQINVALVLLCFYVFYHRSILSSSRFLFYSTISMSVMLGLSSGMLESAVVPLVLLFVVRWHTTRIFPWHMMLAGFVLLILLNSVKSEYRSLSWYGYEGGDLSVVDRISLWLNLGNSQLDLMTSGDAVSNVETLVRDSTKRFDLLHYFVLVQDKTPELVPYYGGETFRYILYGWIPRFIWPDKPIAQQANKIYAVDYGIQTAAGTGSAMFGIGHLAEGYANFGIPGLIIVMLLEGGFFALLNHILNSPHSDGGRAIYIATMVWLLNGIGSNTAFTLMLVITNILGSLFLMRFFAGHWRAKAGSSPASVVYRPSAMLPEKR